MARLPFVDGDTGDWGDVLNEFLGVSHNSDGTLKRDTRLAQAGNYTITASDPGVIGVTNTAAPRTITLPLAIAVPAGRPVTVKDESGGAATNNITVSRAGSDTIDGATTKVISTNYGVTTVYSDGISKWFTR